MQCVLYIYTLCHLGREVAYKCMEHNKIVNITSVKIRDVNQCTRPCRVYDGKCGNGAGFPVSTAVFPS
jgi:hypothetical protein